MLDDGLYATTTTSIDRVAIPILIDIERVGQTNPQRKRTKEEEEKDTHTHIQKKSNRVLLGAVVCRYKTLLLGLPQHKFRPYYFD